MNFDIIVALVPLVHGLQTELLIVYVFVGFFNEMSIIFLRRPFRLRIYALTAVRGLRQLNPR